jgi:hypothetical protein
VVIDIPAVENEQAAAAALDEARLADLAAVGGIQEVNVQTLNALTDPQKILLVRVLQMTGALDPTQGISLESKIFYEKLGANLAVRQQDWDTVTDAIGRVAQIDAQRLAFDRPLTADDAKRVLTEITKKRKKPFGHMSPDWQAQFKARLEADPVAVKYEEAYRLIAQAAEELLITGNASAGNIGKLTAPGTSYQILQGLLTGPEALRFNECESADARTPVLAQQGRARARIMSDEGLRLHSKLSLSRVDREGLLDQLEALARNLDTVSRENDIDQDSRTTAARLKARIIGGDPDMTGVADSFEDYRRGQETNGRGERLYGTQLQQDLADVLERVRQFAESVRGTAPATTPADGTVAVDADAVVQSLADLRRLLRTDAMGSVFSIAGVRR